MSEDAIRFYRRAVEIRPDWDEGWWYLGSLYYDTDHYAQAIPAFQKLIELNPKLGLAWDLLGLSEYETKDYTNSLVHLKRGQELGLEDNLEAVKVAKYHIALLLNLNGQFVKATEVLKSGFEPEHLPDQIKIALGMALLRIPLLPNQVDPSKDALIHAASETAALLAQNNLEQALKSFEQMLKDYPDTPWAVMARSMIALASSWANVGPARMERRAALSDTGSFMEKASEGTCVIVGNVSPARSQSLAGRRNNVSLTHPRASRSGGRRSPARCSPRACS